MKRITAKRFHLIFTAIFTVLISSSLLSIPTFQTAYAFSYGSANIDGNASEWSTADFFANAYIAGDDQKPKAGETFLKYDCSTDTVYVYFRAISGYPLLVSDANAWGLHTDVSTSTKVYRGDSGDDGTPPDFQWINPDGGGHVTDIGTFAYADGYEASFKLGDYSPSSTHYILIHAEVNDSPSASPGHGATAAAATNFAGTKVGIPITLDCSQTPTSADLEVSKTDSQTSVTAGTETTYTITVKNNGPSDAQNVIVDDPIPTGTTFVSADPSNVYDDSTGKWAVGDLANGATATLKVTVKINSDTTGTVVNTAKVSSDTDDPTSDNDSASDTDDVTTSADLEVLKTDNLETVIPGSNITYTITVKNNGPSDAQNVIVDDPIPTGTTFVSADPSNVYDDSTGKWAVGDLANGATATLKVTVKINSDTTGTVVNTATVSSDTDDPTKDNDSSTDNQDVASPSISVKKEVSVDGGTTWLDANTSPGPSLLAGTNPQFRFTVTNTGNVQLSEIKLSDDVYDTSSCTVPLTLDTGDSFSCTITPTWASGQHTDTATASGSFTDSAGNKDSPSSTDSANYFGAAPSISVKKEVSINGGTTWLDANTSPGPTILAGQVVKFRFTVTNTGNVPVSGITLNDNVYGAVCTVTNPLPVGGTYSCTITKTAENLQHTNTVTASGSYTDDGGHTSNPSAQDSANYYGTLSTYTPGGYAGSGTPGKILTNYYSTKFPSGMEVGYYTPNPGFGYKWDPTSTGVKNLKTFMTNAGTPSVIVKDELNPTTAKNGGGTLATHAATLTLNIGFGGLSGTNMPAGFGNLYYVKAGDSLNGKTVQQILDAANKGLAGQGLPSGYTFSSMTVLLTNLNQSFDNSVPTVWAQTYLKVSP